MNNENEQAEMQLILTLMERIERITMDVMYEDFISDRILLEAVAFNLLKLSRLLVKLDKKKQQQLEGVEFGKLGELEEKLLTLEGEKFDDLVWDMVTEGLPALREKMEED